MIEQNHIISVIVPVYKVENFLRQCVDSILTQTVTDFELILVDDGSPDNCPAICDEYAEKDSRVRVIHKKNGGLSDARNAGIDIATGDFICFIDSDDLITEDYLETLTAIQNISKSDVVVCNKFEFWEDKQINLHAGKDISTHFDVFRAAEACVNVYKIGTGLSITACGKIYSKKLFSNVRFPVGKLHEDQATVPILLYNANSVAVTHLPLYLYRQHPDSIMRQKFTSRRFDDVEAIDSCIAYFQKCGEVGIVDAAEKCRNKVIAQNVLLALDQHVANEIPEQFRMNRDQALRLLSKNVPQDYFTDILKRYHPQWVRPYCYLQKLKRLLRISSDN